MRPEDQRLVAALTVLRDQLGPVVDEIAFGELDIVDRRDLARALHSVADALAPDNRPPFLARGAVVQQGGGMTIPRIVSRAEWLAERTELLTREKEFTRARDTLNAARRGLGMVKIDKPYVFEGQHGKASLLDLFEGRRQLVVQHFMFDPSWDEGCPTCSFDADHLAHLEHLHARDTTYTAVSRAPLTKIERYRTRMGWMFPWYSVHGSDFNYDFHVTLDPSRTPVTYNYTDAAEFGLEGPTEMPGVSVFLRDRDDVFHTYSAYARGTDLLNATYNYLDLTPLGRQEGWGGTPNLDGLGVDWIRRHDSYPS